jgi:hypothetical protein
VCPPRCKPGAADSSRDVRVSCEIPIFVEIPRRNVQIKKTGQRLPREPDLVCAGIELIRQITKGDPGMRDIHHSNPSSLQFLNMCAAVPAQITKANLKARLLMRVLNVGE